MKSIRHSIIIFLGTTLLVTAQDAQLAPLDPLKGLQGRDRATERAAMARNIPATVTARQIRPHAPLSEKAKNMQEALQTRAKYRRYAEDILRNKNSTAYKQNLTSEALLKSAVFSKNASGGKNAPTIKSKPRNEVSTAHPKRPVGRNTVVDGYIYKTVELKWQNYDNYMSYVFWGDYEAPIPAEESTITVYFDNVDMETGYDFVYVVDADGYECDHFTGYDTDFWSATCVGNYAALEVYTDATTDGTLTASGEISPWNGFKATQAYYTHIDRNTDPISRPLLSDNDVTIGESIYFQGDQSYDPDFFDSIQDYQWSFGDGSSSLNKNSYHSYGAPGFYTGSLEVWDETTGYGKTTFNVNVRPISKPRNLVVAASGQNYLDFSWDKGDYGNDGFIVDFDEGTNPSLSCSDTTYTTNMGSTRYAGYDNLKSGTAYTFIVCAYNTAWQRVGDPWISEVARITAFTSSNNAPIAQGTVTPLTLSEGLSIHFDGSSSYDPDQINNGISAYQWDFGDGTASTASGDHKFQNPGTYIVLLTVWDRSNPPAVAYKPFTVQVFPVTAANSLTDVPQQRSITFNWNGGTDTAGYKVHFGPGNGTDLSCSHPQAEDIGNVKTKTYSGLTPNTAYSIKVCTYNAATNPKHYAPATSLTTKTKSATPPIAFGPLTVKPLPSGSYEISFRAPEAPRTYELERHSSFYPDNAWQTAQNTNGTPMRVTSTAVNQTLTFIAPPLPRTTNGFFRVKALTD